ncbi:MAG TPA: TIM-barrel domain-containing protein, partial [Terracidiphilus sp.]|nr:TIM-barrel domain-containing protein [Terracidiphilus sp.]
MMSKAAQAAANVHSNIPGLYNPVADPKAVVTFGHARFTVLTPQLIRMEWSDTDTFEDHASFVFLNRRLFVPAFEHTITGRTLTIRTSALTLSYTNAGHADVADAGFTPENLTISLSVDSKPVVWHPGMKDPGNLEGTTRTLDEALGSHTKEPIGQGLVSRTGWALVDDSTRPLFDSADFSFTRGEKSPWPWVVERPSSERPGAYQDWYFFGYGHDYRKALGDYVRVAGRIPLPPRFAFGAWWSRYWAYSDQELEQLVRGFHDNDTPLDVLVIDMDWHISGAQLAARGEKDASGQTLGWT